MGFIPMDHTTNAPPIHSANMGGPSGRSSVTTGRTMRTPAGLGGTQSTDPADLAWMHRSNNSRTQVVDTKCPAVVKE